VADATAEVGSDISRQWIIAHVLGGIALNAVPFIAASVIRQAGIRAGNIDSVDLFVLGISFAVVYSLGVAALGYLSGRVLRQKLPLFPMRAWLILFTFFGGLFGLVAAVAWVEENSELGSVGFDDLMVSATGVLVAGLFGLFFGLAAGAFQALVLRNSAEGLPTWLIYSALAGLPIVVMAPGTNYLSTSGLAREVVDALAGLFVTVAGAFIMLPALHRLRPR
jgi:hypothetical protein